MAGEKKFSTGELVAAAAAGVLLGAGGFMAYQEFVATPKPGAGTPAKTPAVTPPK